MTRKTVFFPALVADLSSKLAKDTKLPNGVGCRFYNEDEGGFYHPYALFSAPHHIRHLNLRKTMGIGGDCTVFLDSGGFQLLQNTAPKDYCREQAFEWCSDTKGIFPILDYPTVNSDIAECLEFSVQSARYYEENKKMASNSKVLNVLSARKQSDINQWHRLNPRTDRPRTTLEEMEYWYKGISKHELDGWAYGGHMRNGKAIVQAVLFLLNKGELQRKGTTWLHLFGVSKSEVMLYAGVMQQMLNEAQVDVQLSYDSSSFSHSSKHGQFYAFNSLNGLFALPLIRERNTNLGQNAFTYDFLENRLALPQTSPVFEGIDCVKKLLGDQTRYTVLSLHNLYMMLRQKELFDFIAHCGIPEILESLPPQLRSNVHAIQAAFRNPSSGFSILDRAFDTQPKTVKKRKVPDKSNLLRFAA